MSMPDKQPNNTELALQQAYRSLALADRDRQQGVERENALTKEIVELRKLIDDWFRPRISALEHANADLNRRCREAEVALRAQAAT